MKSPIKKTYLLFTFVGLVFLGFAGYQGYQKYQVLTQGELVSAEVIDIEISKGDSGTMYSPRFRYEINGEEREYVNSFKSNFNTYSIGDEVPLRVLDKKVAIAKLTPDYLFIGGFLFLGIVMTSIGLTQSVRHARRYHRGIRLKRTGKKIEARYIRSDYTDYTLNDQKGTILYFKADNDDQIFTTPPIFSDFSPEWLQSHVFDVYVNPHDSEDYYIDIEKYFGEPVKHRK